MRYADYKKMKKAELIENLKAMEIASKAKSEEIARLKPRLEAIDRQRLCALDAIEIFYNRYNDLTGTELAQLGVCQVVDGEPLFTDLTDALSIMQQGEKGKQTAAKFRIMKGHFQAHQWAVKRMLNRLNDLGAKNRVSMEDIRRLRELRTDVGNMIRREI